jgi:hypothetical protein
MVEGSHVVKLGSAVNGGSGNQCVIAVNMSFAKCVALVPKARYPSLPCCSAGLALPGGQCVPNSSMHPKSCAYAWRSVVYTAELHVSPLMV